jgi:ABC-type transporter Mla MlaB component
MRRQTGQEVTDGDVRQTDTGCLWLLAHARLEGAHANRSQGQLERAARALLLLARLYIGG